VHGEQVVATSGVDLAFHGTLRFADDVVAQIDSSFAASRYQRLEALGEEGVLVVGAPWRPDWGGSLAVHRAGGVEQLEPPVGDSFLLELEALADAVAGVSPPLVGRDEALGQARVIDALYRAAEQRAPVAV